MTVEIDRETLDEVDRILEGDFVNHLAGKTPDFSAVAFILNSVITAVQEAREQLDNK